MTDAHVRFMHWTCLLCTAKGLPARNHLCRNDPVFHTGCNPAALADFTAAAAATTAAAAAAAEEARIAQAAEHREEHAAMEA
jgi:hypothetical protein